MLKKNRMFQCLSILGIITMIFGSFPSGITNDFDSSNPPHNAAVIPFIHINNNWTIMQTFYPEYIAGSGTWFDPYRIENATIDGQGIYHGIYIIGTEDPYIIQNCTINNTNDIAAIYLQQSSNATIRNNTLYSGLGNAIQTFYSHNLLIENNSFVDFVYSGIKLIGTNNGTYRYNNFTDCNTGIWKFQGFDNLIEYNNCTNNLIGVNSFNEGSLIINNYFSGSIISGIRIAGNDTIVDQNEFHGDSTGVEILSTDDYHNNSISNNTFDNNLMGISVGNENNTIANNIIQSFTTGAIILDQGKAKDNIVFNNTIIGDLGAQSGYGILLNDAEVNNHILNNTLVDIPDQAIWVFYSDNQTIANNKIKDSHQGIQIVDSTNCSLLFNYINGSENSNINLEYSNNTKIHGNEILHSPFGVYIAFSHYVNCTNNTFRDNTNHDIFENNAADNILSPNDFQDATLSISANMTSIVEGMYVQFYSTASGDGALSYFWDFGDYVGTSTDAEPVYQFWVSTQAEVVCTVTDADGDTQNDTIIITGQPDYWPSAVINVDSGPYYNGTAINFQSGSYDGNPPFQYQWSFGDETINSTVELPTHTYALPGFYSINFTIIDFNGDISTTGMIIEILEDLWPTAYFTVNATNLFEGEYLQMFDGSSSGNGNLDYTYSFNNSIVDQYEPNPIVYVFELGPINITLTVQDSDGDISTYSMVVMVEHDIFPNAAFTISFGTTVQTSDGVANGSFYISTTLSFAHIGEIGNPDSSFQWNMGDGSANLTTHDVSHSYQDSGNYTVTLTIVDRDGDMHSFKQTILVIADNDDSNNPGAPSTPDLSELFDSPVSKGIFFGLIGVIVLYGIMVMMKGGKKSKLKDKQGTSQESRDVEFTF